MLMSIQLPFHNVQYLHRI